MTGTFNRFWSDLDLKASGWCRNTGAGGGWQSLETFNCFELMFHSESWLMMVMALHDSEYSTQPDILIQYIYIYIYIFFFKLREAHLGRKCLKMAGEIEYLHLCCGSKPNFVLGLIQSAMTRQKKWWLNYTCGLYACVLPLFGCTAVWSGITGGLPAAWKRSGTCWLNTLYLLGPGTFWGAALLLESLLRRTCSLQTNNCRGINRTFPNIVWGVWIISLKSWSFYLCLCSH